MARRRGAICRGVTQFNKSIGVNLAGGGVEVEAVDPDTGSAEGSATRERDVAERWIGDVPAGEREPHRRCGQRTRHLRRAFEPAGETARIRARESGSLGEIDSRAGVQGDRRPFGEDVGPSGNHYAALPRLGDQVFDPDARAVERQPSADRARHVGLASLDGEIGRAERAGAGRGVTPRTSSPEPRVQSKIQGTEREGTLCGAILERHRQAG